MNVETTNALYRDARNIGLDDEQARRLVLANTCALILGDEHADAVNVIALVEFVDSGAVPIEARVGTGELTHEEAVEGEPAPVHMTPGTAFGPSTRKADGPHRG